MLLELNLKFFIACSAKKMSPQTAPNWRHGMIPFFVSQFGMSLFYEIISGEWEDFKLFFQTIYEEKR